MRIRSGSPVGSDLFNCPLFPTRELTPGPQLLLLGHVPPPCQHPLDFLVGLPALVASPELLLVKSSPTKSSYSIALLRWSAPSRTQPAHGLPPAQALQTARAPQRGCDSLWPGGWDSIKAIGPGCTWKPGKDGALRIFWTGCCSPMKPDPYKQKRRIWREHQGPKNNCWRPRSITASWEGISDAQPLPSGLCRWPQRKLLSAGLTARQACEAACANGAFGRELCGPSCWRRPGTAPGHAQAARPESWVQCWWFFFRAISPDFTPKIWVILISVQLHSWGWEEFRGQKVKTYFYWIYWVSSVQLNNTSSAHCIAPAVQSQVSVRHQLSSPPCLGHHTTGYCCLLVLLWLKPFTLFTPSSHQ